MRSLPLAVWRKQIATKKEEEEKEMVGERE